MQANGVIGLRPLFEHVADQLEGMVAEGGGSPLPSERDLARQFGVNRATIRRALVKLQSDGTLFRRTGKGRRRSASVDLDRSSIAISILVTEYDYGWPGLLADWDRADLMGASHVPIHRGLSRSLRAAEYSGGVWLDIDHELLGPGRSPESALRAIAARNVVGLAYWPMLPASDLVIAQLRAMQTVIPVVLLDRRIWGFEADQAAFDVAKGGRLMGEHLVRLGHERVAFIGNALPDMVHEYFQGVDSAFIAKGRHIDSNDTFFIRNESIDIGNFLGPLLARSCDRRPSALVCANDTLARMALTYLSERGLRVPDDMAVVGVDDCNSVAGELLGLTTLRVPYQELGEAAATILLERMRRPWTPGRPITRLATPTLMVRRSCGAMSHAIVQETPPCKEEHSR